jgi:hypothetical protein
MGLASQKSIGFIIDELITVSQKCFHAQDDIMDETLSTEARLAAAVRAQKMNAIRNALIREIDEFFGQGHMSPTTKTYYTYFKDDKKDV